MGSTDIRVIPTNCDFSPFYTEQQDQTIGLILLIGFVIIFSLVYIKNNKGAF